MRSLGVDCYGKRSWTQSFRGEKGREREKVVQRSTQKGKKIENQGKAKIMVLKLLVFKENFLKSMHYPSTAIIVIMM